MFRKSLQILLAAALLALAAIVAFALLCLRGAPETLAEAEQHLAENRYAQAIKVLDLCEGGWSMQRDQALRQRLWRLRLLANSKLQNARAALLDVENLLADGLEADEELQLEHIRLLAKSGQGGRALSLARGFLERHPDHGRALELAGEASRAATAEALERLTTTIERDVGQTAAAAARRALGVYLHTPPGDAAVAQSITALAQMYADEPRLSATWPQLLRQLRDLQRDIQEGLSYCRAALEKDGEPVSAQRTIEWSLQESQRTFDLLMQCEIYRRRFDHESVAGAGKAAAWALLDQGDYAAAISTAERWLPSAALQRRIDDGTLGDDAPDLLLARCVAAWRLDDRNNIARLYGDMVVLHRGEVQARLPRHLTIGLLHLQNKEYKNCDGNLRLIHDIIVREEPKTGGIDLLSDVTTLRLTLQPLMDLPEAASLELMKKWREERPDALAPKLTLVNHLIERGRLPAAQEVLAEVGNTEPGNEQVFRLRVTVAAAIDELAGQSGAELLAQCMRNRVPVPDVASPFGYVHCAQAALAQQAYGVARASARMAVEAFPQQRLPRLLEIEAALRSNRPQEALRLSQRLVAMLPVDAATALSSLEAHRAAQEPLSESLFLALPHCPPSPELRADILRAALEQDRLGAVTWALPVLQDPTTPAGLRLLAARALAVAGRPADCKRMLDEVPATTPFTATERIDLCLATAAWIEAAARTTDDATLLPAAESAIQRLDVRGTVGPDAILGAATAIAATHPRTSYALCRQALVAADPESRSGASFVLAGNLAARLGNTQKAEEHWFAALAFADGRDCAKDLVRLCLSQGRLDRAMLVYRLVDDDDDPTLVGWRGDKVNAERLAKAALDRDGLDLLAHATLAALGKPGLADWQDTPVPSTEARFELLALLGGTLGGRLGGKAPDHSAVARAQTMVDADPTSMTASLLLARAHVLAGSPAQAATIHASLLSRGAMPLLCHELAFAARTPGYVLSKPAETALIEAATTGTIASSPATTAFALQRIIDNLATAGHPAAAQTTREALWPRYPRELVRTTADVAHVAAFQDPQTAWTLLTALLASEETGGPSKKQEAAFRAAVREQLYARARQLADQPTRDLTEIYTTALGHVTSEGPYGCIVHFLLDHGDRQQERRPDAAFTRQLLLEQLALAATGRDPGPWLDRSVTHLLREQGADQALADVESVLRQHPTSLALWQARATLLEHTPDVAQGIADLRAVLLHAAAPEATLAALTLAAAHGPITAADDKQLDALPKAQQTSPEGKFARGLIALRLGKPDAAVPLLAAAAPRADGAHLFALALACLQSRDNNGATQALGHLQALVRDYPSSSLADNAGSCARQLAPR